MSFLINNLYGKNKREECVQTVPRSEAYRKNCLLYSLIERGEECVQTTTRLEGIQKKNCLLYSLIWREEECVQTVQGQKVYRESLLYSLIEREEKSVYKLLQG